MLFILEFLVDQSYEKQALCAADVQTKRKMRKFSYLNRFVEWEGSLSFLGRLLMLVYYECVCIQIHCLDVCVDGNFELLLFTS